MTGAFRTFMVLPALVSLVLGSSTASAAKPQLDSGAQISQEKPYESAQVISDVFSNKAVYGKLEGSAAVDIYKIKPDKDGEQTFSLLDKADAPGSTGAQPLLIFVDPTDATEAQSLQLPMPSEAYHSAIITSLETPKEYRESALLQNYMVTAEQKIALKKDTEYYLIVIEPYGQPASYVIKFGTESSWTAGDFFQSFGSWIRLQTNSYAGSTPFTFTSNTAVFLLLLVGLGLLIGTFLIEHTLVFLSNRLKAAGYILIKFQPYSRLITWIALWFTAMGAYMHFDRLGWVGLPFVMFLVFLVLVASLLYYTFRLSPRIAALEVTKREATISKPLRKRLAVSFAISLVSLAAFSSLLGMYLVK